MVMLAWRVPLFGCKTDYVFSDVLTHAHTTPLGDICPRRFSMPDPGGSCRRVVDEPPRSTNVEPSRSPGRRVRERSRRSLSRNSQSFVSFAVSSQPLTNPPAGIVRIARKLQSFFQRGYLSVISSLDLGARTKRPSKTLRLGARIPDTMALMRGLRSLLVLGTNYSRASNPAILARAVSTMQPLAKNKEVTITFVKANGERIKAKGEIGNSILDIVVNNDLDLGGYGACEGTLTCSTCHLIFSKEAYDGLPDEPSEEELDMLELAQERGETSRLGCQITMTEKLDGIEVRVPATINDARET